MGLDTSHNCWHGPYSTFNDFRKWLGELASVDLDEYIEYSYRPEDKPNKTLDEISDNYLYPLFNHADCDGELSVGESKLIIRGIDYALSMFNNQMREKTSRDLFFYEKAIQFKNGLLEAVKNNEMVIFR